MKTRAEERGTGSSPRDERAGRNLREDVDLAGSCVVNASNARSPLFTRPDTQLISHYFRARLSDQFDAILHYDHTRAVEPLERAAQWQAGEIEETLRSGL
jgi:hypothetical protein